MLAHFPGDLPVTNLYHRLKWRGGLVAPEWHNEKSGRWKVPICPGARPVPGVSYFADSSEWIDDTQVELESEETYFEYMQERPESIQYQWWKASGYYIADIRVPENHKEVAKYIGKWSEIEKLPPNVLVSFLQETRGLRRWILGGEFRQLSAEWNKPIDENEATGEGWEQLTTIKAGLLSEDRAVLAATVQAVAGSLWAIARPDELRALYDAGAPDTPAWVHVTMLKSMKEPDD